MKKHRMAIVGDFLDPVLLTIMNGYFEHKDIHKYTWECRGRGLRTIIDYFAVRKAIRPAVANVKVI